MIREEKNAIRRLLIVLPNWVGDVVLASPALAALRDQFRDAQITFLMRSYLRDLVNGCEWHDHEIYWPASRGLSGVVRSLDFPKSLRTERFDAAILLTNSFRSAFTVYRAGIPRRIGYAREARGWMLTDRKQPLRANGRFVPAPVTDYYCDLAEIIAEPITDRRLRLGLVAADERHCRELLDQHNVPAGTRYAAVNPGAKFGSSKCWLPEYFATLCDKLARERDLLPLLVGSPAETPLMRHIAELANERVVCIADPGTTLGTLKPLIRDAALLVCNDTGPRHFGNAFNVPTVCIFGPTHQEWTDTGYQREIKLQRDVPCGPCQLKECPLDLRCMHEMKPDEVFAACDRVVELPVAC